eukprot:FR736657.1.p1 GENE.FR736657.1~~FR736657.1.p1  ORF type:complete len:145 (+),score=9.97 FR736657.1:34-468(+)
MTLIANLLRLVEIAFRKCSKPRKSVLAALNAKRGSNTLGSSSTSSEHEAPLTLEEKQERHDFKIKKRAMVDKRRKQICSKTARKPNRQYDKRKTSTQRESMHQLNPDKAEMIQCRMRRLNRNDEFRQYVHDRKKETTHLPPIRR